MKKVTTLLLTAIAICCQALLYSAEVVVNWPLSFIQPTLQVVCLDSKNMYWISGVELEGAKMGKRCLYNLPEEIEGVCLLTLYEGKFSSGFGHYTRVEISQKTKRLEVEFPPLLGLFELEIKDESFPPGDKIVIIYRYLPDGKTLDPYFFYGTSLNENQGLSMAFGAHFIGPGRYLVSITANRPEGLLMGKVLYQKELAVTEDQLFHIDGVELSREQLFETGPTIKCLITQKDTFNAIVAPRAEGSADFTVKSVDATGKIVAVYPPSP